VSWRSWAKPPPAPWRLLGGHPHLDMSTCLVSTVTSRYPNPSAPWPPMTFLPRSTLSTCLPEPFYIFLPSQTAFDWKTSGYSQFKSGENLACTTVC
jgi:hypothetical protein